MKKIATATIATAGVAAIAIAGQGHEAHAAEQGYNPNDPTSYSYSYTIDQQGNYHYTWKGNWSPDRLNHSNYNYSYNNYHTNNSNQVASNPTQSYTTNNQQTGGLGSASASTSNNNVKVTTVTAPSSTGASISNSVSSGRNYYTSGQCTYYVYDRVGGKIGSTWGNANNWANAAASAGYTVNNRPSAGAIMQSTAGAYGHVAYVESVNSNGSITVSEMNYGHGVGVVTSRTLSSSEAASYNFIH